MKREYDFSQGERGKFYHPQAELNLPIYLEPYVADFLRGIAQTKGTDIEAIVNDWLKRDIELIQTAT